MLRQIAMTVAAAAAFALSATAAADNGWWGANDTDNYRNGDYQARNGAYRAGYAYADVLHVEPVYRYVRVRTPQRECWDEQIRTGPQPRPHNTAAATVTGGLIGGAIGHQFGDGNGRRAMTIVGTLLGSAIGHDEAHRRNQELDYYDRPRIRTVERCTTRYISREERRIEGYHVTYAYAGREYTTRTAHRPGNRIQVRVAVIPAVTGRY